MTGWPWNLQHPVGCSRAKKLWVELKWLSVPKSRVRVCGVPERSPVALAGVYSWSVLETSHV